MKRTRRVAIACAVAALIVAAPAVAQAASGSVHLETRGFDIETASTVPVTASSSDVRIGTNQSTGYRQLVAMNSGGVTKFPPDTTFDSLTCPQLRAATYTASILTGSSPTQDPVVGTVYAARSVLDGYVKLLLTRVDRSPPNGLIFDFVTFQCGTDTTPPVITPSVDGPPGNEGWFVGDVTASWDVADGQSDIESSSGCATSILSEDTLGTTLTCTATSSGGTASASVSVMIDATPPVVSYSGNAGSYTVDQQVQIACEASDATSGPAGDTCEQVDAPAYTFSAGENTLAATATDVAGNAGSGSTTFTLVIDAAGLDALIDRFVTQPGVANSMKSKIDNAFAAPNENARRGMFQAFRNEVRAQTGQTISEEDADVLLRLVGSF